MVNATVDTIPQSATHPSLDATVDAIMSIYKAPPQEFEVGEHHNELGKSRGSLAILGFAKLHNLPTEVVLPMFGEAYAEVLVDPDGTSHPNIRAFMKCGVEGVHFSEGGIELHNDLSIIERAWENRADISPEDIPSELYLAILSVVSQLDSGEIRSAMKLGDHWFINQTVKKAILLWFKTSKNKIVGQLGQMTGTFLEGVVYYDKVPLKFADWSLEQILNCGFRAVPGSIVRRSAYIGKGVILMPSLVNVGAYVGDGTMVDTWATVGSCAQIGKNCHISGGAGIGGVLEPLQASPTIIEDNCFIGARSEVAEGVIVREGAVLSMGVFIGKNTPIYDRTKGIFIRGEVPSRAVVMMGVHPENGLICPQIVKYRDKKTDAATALNEILRG